MITLSRMNRNGTALPATSVPGVSLPLALRRFFSESCQFRGRASRSEYWWWMLVNIIVLALTQYALPALIIGSVTQPTIFLGPLGSAIFAPIELASIGITPAALSPTAAFFLFSTAVWLAVTIIPGTSIAVRRLHDSSLSAWWLLLAIVPLGAIVVLILEGRRSTA
ncbi:MAG: DUF805 domain-containing protein [Rhodoglobus sp.]